MVSHADLPESGDTTVNNVRRFWKCARSGRFVAQAWALSIDQSQSAHSQLLDTFGDDIDSALIARYDLAGRRPISQ
jgi:hypothetical protein